MRRFIIIPLAIISCGLNMFSQTPSEPFFSEYVEGSGNNKAVEIYNPTNTIIDLSNYYVARYSNGAYDYTSGGITQLLGYLGPFDTHVLVNGQTTSTETSPACSPVLQAMADQLDGAYPAPTYMNGNDAIALFKDAVGNGNPDDFILVDLFGIIGGGMTSDDEGWVDFTEKFVYRNIYDDNGNLTGKDSAYINNYIVPEGYYWVPWSCNHTLIRKPEIVKGVTSETMPTGEFNVSLEWDTLPGGQDIWDHLGWHDCISNSCVLEDITVDSTIIRPSCYGKSDGSISLQVTGPDPEYTFLWSDRQETNEISDLSAGEYRVTIYGSNNCSKELTFKISQPDLISVREAKYNPKCYGLNDGAIALSIAGGTQPYSFLWSNDATSDSISNLYSGFYSVAVTDKNGCLSEKEFTLNDPYPLTVYANINSNNCFGEKSASIDLHVEGGTSPYSFLWNNGENTSSIINLPQGTYSVIITDYNLCLFQKEYEIQDPEEINIGSIIGQDIIESFETYIYSVSYLVNVNYIWNATGGNVISGQGTNVIEIQWGSGDSLLVQVYAVNELGCESATLELGAHRSTFIDDSDQSYVTFYPNPVSNELFIKAESPINASIQDINGRTVKYTSEKYFELSELEPNVYILVIEDLLINRNYHYLFIKR